MKVIIDFIEAFGHEFAAASGSITALAAVLTAFSAYMGLKTWRQKLKGVSEYALAKDVLKAAYQVREAFKHVRHPVVDFYEYPEKAQQPDSKLDENQIAEATEYAYQNRFKILNEAFTALEGKVIDAEVEWGNAFEGIMIPLRGCGVDLQMAIIELVDSKRPEHKRKGFQSMDFAERNYILYYGSKSRHNTFTSKIDDEMHCFEKILRPIIGRRIKRLRIPS